MDNKSNQLTQAYYLVLSE